MYIQLEDMTDYYGLRGNSFETFCPHNDRTEKRKTLYIGIGGDWWGNINAQFPNTTPK